MELQGFLGSKIRVLSVENDRVFFCAEKYIICRKVRILFRQLTGILGWKCEYFNGTNTGYFGSRKTGILSVETAVF